jgi:hypothetical protein
MNNVAPLREQIVTKLYSAVLSDALDAAGRPRQAMRPFLRPLDDSLVLFGRVRTGLYANSYHVDLSKNPYAVEIALVDDLQSSRPTSPSADGPTPCDPKMTTALLCGDFMVEPRSVERTPHMPGLAGGESPQPIAVIGYSALIH